MGTKKFFTLKVEDGGQLVINTFVYALVAGVVGLIFIMQTASCYHVYDPKLELTIKKNINEAYDKVEDKIKARKQEQQRQLKLANSGIQIKYVLCEQAIIGFHDPEVNIIIMTGTIQNGPLHLNSIRMEMFFKEADDDYEWTENDYFFNIKPYESQRFSIVHQVQFGDHWSCRAQIKDFEPAKPKP